MRKFTACTLVPATMLALAGLLAACGGPAGAAGPAATVDVVAPCADPVVSTPSTGPFHPGGASFGIAAETGAYRVTCGDTVVLSFTR